MSLGNITSLSDPGRRYVYNIFSAAARKSARLMVRDLERAETFDSGESWGVGYPWRGGGVREPVAD